MIPRPVTINGKTIDANKVIYVRQWHEITTEIDHVVIGLDDNSELVFPESELSYRDTCNLINSAC